MEEHYYGQFSYDHLKKISDGIELFNDEKYWECHEFLEGLWLEDIADNARLVYWAILQVAVSLYHLREDNLVGAAGLLKKAKDKFSRCEKLKVETPLLFDHLNWGGLKKTVRSIPESPNKNDFRALLNFKFKLKKCE
jgi:uncharacterized protein